MRVSARGGGLEKAQGERKECVRTEVVNDTRSPDGGVDTRRCFPPLCPVGLPTLTSPRWFSPSLAGAVSDVEMQEHYDEFFEVSGRQRQMSLCNFICPLEKKSMHSCSSGRLGKAGKVMEFANAVFQAWIIPRIL